MTTDGVENKTHQWWTEMSTWVHSSSSNSIICDLNFQWIGCFALKAMIPFEKY